MHLVRDLLDNQVTDERNRKMGKVDGIVLVLRQGRPPRVAAIELGMATLLGRISHRLGAFAARLEQRWGIADGAPVRIAFDKIESIGIDVRVEIDADRTTVYDWERWIGRVLIDRIPIPGGGAVTRASPASEPRARREPAERLPRARVGESEGRSPSDKNEVHVEQLIGRQVHDTEGRRIGRIAEIVARKEQGEFVVASYIVGPIAWIHRFAVAALDLRMRGLGRVYRVAWDEMDLSDPDHPRATRRREELAREVLPRRKRGLTRRPARRLA